MGRIFIEESITMTDAAKRTGISKSWWNHRIRTGKIDSCKVGYYRVIAMSEFDRVVREYGLADLLKEGRKMKFLKALKGAGTSRYILFKSRKYRYVIRKKSAILKQVGPEMRCGLNIWWPTLTEQGDKNWKVGDSINED